MLAESAGEAVGPPPQREHTRNALRPMADLVANRLQHQLAARSTAAAAAAAAVEHDEE